MSQNFKSKYFKLIHFAFTKKQIEEAIKDLKRFLRIFEATLRKEKIKEGRKKRYALPS